MIDGVNRFESDTKQHDRCAAERLPEQALPGLPLPGLSISRLSISGLALLMTLPLMLTPLALPAEAQGPSGGFAGGQLATDTPQTLLTPVPRTQTAPATPGSLYDPYTTSATPGVYTPALPGAQPIPPVAAVPGLGTTYANSSTPNFGYGNPGFTTQAYGQTYPPPTYGQPAFGQPSYGQPGYGQQPGFGTTILPPAAYPPEAYPSNSPTTLFPGGLFSGGMMAGTQGTPFSSLRFMQPRLQHGWIRGGDGDRSLDMNETDVALTFAFPQFLYSSQPLYVTPAFGLTLLNGPHSSTGADLPGQVYSGTLSADWQSDPAQMFSIDLGLTLGMYSDFDTNISDSFRVLGRGVGHFRITPYSTLKGGVHVISRNRHSVLPAVGLLYTPNQYTRYDLFFPEPKLSHYTTTLGTQDIWCYISGEYGGGTWTVERDSGLHERVDINDIRVMLGIEWGRSDLIRNGQRTGFAEFGVVFNRELYYKSRSVNIDPHETFMIRLGLGY